MGFLFNYITTALVTLLRKPALHLVLSVLGTWRPGHPVLMFAR